MHLKENATQPASLLTINCSGKTGFAFGSCLSQWPSVESVACESTSVQSRAEVWGTRAPWISVLQCDAGISLFVSMQWYFARICSSVVPSNICCHVGELFKFNSVELEREVESEVVSNYPYLLWVEIVIDFLPASLPPILWTCFFLNWRQGKIINLFCTEIMYLSIHIYCSCILVQLI